jgi:hypothetical protein
MVDIYTVFHPTTRQYTLFSAAHGTFSKKDHILGHKASLKKMKKIEIPPASYQITRPQQQKYKCNKFAKGEFNYDIL